MSGRSIPFAVLEPREDAGAIRTAIDRVIASGWFILGPEVEGFEAEFAAASGATHAIGVGNGTDGIAIVLRALGIGAGDEVITTPLSAAFTGLAIMMAGARPVFADIDPVRMTLDPEAVAHCITARTRAIVPVHLYGQSADMSSIEQIARRHRLAIVEDCCQAHLGTAEGRAVGTVGVAGVFSFYPTKNLGALGDGGAVITNDAALAERVRRLRNGGQSERYVHDVPGVNSRLDEMQAAILRARLPFLSGWTARRRALAAAYRRGLAGAPVAVPPEIDAGHVYHLFVIRSRQREALQQHLTERGIGTLIHYPVPLQEQTAFAGGESQHCPHAVTACREVLSLPLYPGLDDSDQRRVLAAMGEFQEH